jgi:hypothetical protein
MNQVAKWCKFKGYGDWCYEYRIPDESEFINGFEYEFANFTKTTPREFDTVIEVWWGKYKVGDKSEIWKHAENKNVLSHIKSYLEAGYIRVKKKADERINNQKQSMKLYYYTVDKWDLIRDPKTNEILKYEHDYEKEKDIEFVVIEASSALEGMELIQKSHRIEIPGRPDDHSMLTFNEKEAYVIGLGNEIITNLVTEPYKIMIIGEGANKRANEFLPKIPITLKKSFRDKWNDKIKPNLKAFRNIVFRKGLDTITPSIKEWKPIVHPKQHQPEKSPNKLVCIAIKDRNNIGRVLTWGSDFMRLPWNKANEKITTQLADEPQWEYISKEEYRKLLQPIPGRSFTPRLGQIGYTKQIKFPSKPSSSKIAKCKRKSKHTVQGVSLKKLFHTYEVSYIRNIPDGTGTAEFVYTIIASNNEQAISRGNKKLKLEGADLAYFKPVVKRTIESNRIVKPKGESIYKRSILPKILDLPIWKNKLGNIIPWTKKVLSKTPDTDGGFKIINEEVKTYTKYEISYHKLASPFNKTKKNWKHPIKDGRTIIPKK